MSIKQPCWSTVVDGVHLFGSFIAPCPFLLFEKSIQGEIIQLKDVNPQRVCYGRYDYYLVDHYDISPRVNDMCFIQMLYYMACVRTIRKFRTIRRIRKSIPYIWITSNLIGRIASFFDKPLQKKYIYIYLYQYHLQILNCVLGCLWERHFFQVTVSYFEATRIYRIQNMIYNYKV